MCESLIPPGAAAILRTVISRAEPPLSARAAPVQLSDADITELGRRIGAELAAALRSAPVAPPTAPGVQEEV